LNQHTIHPSRGKENIGACTGNSRHVSAVYRKILVGDVNVFLDPSGNGFFGKKFKRL
jgi:hypothetical protein